MAENSSDKKTLFISHIHEDALYAATIKDILKEHFREAFDIFVSSDSESINLGDCWQEQTLHGLRKSSIVLVLCSPVSIVRPWVNFEAGGAFCSQICTIPLCIRGLEISQLQLPLSMLQAMKLYTHDDFERLASTIADQLNLGSYAMNTALTDKYVGLIQTTKKMDSYKDEYIIIYVLLSQEILEFKKALKYGFTKKETTELMDHDICFENSKNLFNTASAFIFKETTRKRAYHWIQYAYSSLVEQCKIALPLSNDPQLKKILVSLMIGIRPIKSINATFDSVISLRSSNPDDFPQAIQILDKHGTISGMTGVCAQYAQFINEYEKFMFEKTGKPN